MCDMGCLLAARVFVGVCFGEVWGKGGGGVGSYIGNDYHGFIVFFCFAFVDFFI